MTAGLNYKLIKPNNALADFVESFWYLEYQSESEAEKIIIPDGNIDLFLSKSETQPFRIELKGLETKSNANTFYTNFKLCAISFRPLAAEYILRQPIANLVNGRKILPNNFWNFTATDIDDFDKFCKKASQKIRTLLPGVIDNRKQQLFKLIYTSNGAVPVKELCESVYWSRQQANRYFKKHLGLSVKSYCNIIRFHASLPHIKEGKLFPQQNFADQSHFIKDVKKFSSVAPKQLHKNKNERFIQFSVLDGK